MTAGQLLTVSRNDLAEHGDALVYAGCKDGLAIRRDRDGQHVGIVLGELLKQRAAAGVPELQPSATATAHQLPAGQGCEGPNPAAETCTSADGCCCTGRVITDTQARLRCTVDQAGTQTHAEQKQRGGV